MEPAAPPAQGPTAAAQQCWDGVPCAPGTHYLALRSTGSVYQQDALRHHKFFLTRFPLLVRILEEDPVGPVLQRARVGLKAKSRDSGAELLDRDAAPVLLPGWVPWTRTRPPETLVFSHVTEDTVVKTTATIL